MNKKGEKKEREKREKKKTVLEVEMCRKRQLYHDMMLKAYCAIRHTWRIVLLVCKAFNFCTNETMIDKIEIFRSVALVSTKRH